MAISSVSTFGREKELWEVDRSEFISRGGFLSESATGKAIYCLSDDEFSELAANCDPAEDNLIHVDSEGFSVNHGNVGTRGIWYDF